MTATDKNASRTSLKEGLTAITQLVASGDRRSLRQIAAAILLEKNASQAEFESIIWALNSTQQWRSSLRLARRYASQFPADAMGHRQLSSIASLMGLKDLALESMKTAHDLAGNDPAYTFHCANTFLHHGYPSIALKYAIAAVRSGFPAGEAYMLMAVACDRLQYWRYAVKFAVQAIRKNYAPETARMFLAHVLNTRGKPLLGAHTIMALGTEASLNALRTAASLYMSACRHESALACMEIAVGKSQADPDIYFMRSVALRNLGHMERAEESLRRAIALRDDPAFRRQMVTIALDRDDMGTAIAENAKLIADDPDKAEFHSSMFHVLSLKLQTKSIDASKLVRLKSNSTQRKQSREQLGGFAERSRIISALLLREITTRYSHSRIGYLWALIEPSMHILALAFVFQFTMKGLPPLGESFFFFYFTGVMPYQLLSHVANQTIAGVEANRHLLQIPKVHTFDVFVSRALLEFGTDVLVIILFLFLFSIMGTQVFPFNVFSATYALLVTAIIGFGLGLIFACIAVISTFGHFILNTFFRLLYFCSGIFYVPAIMPPLVRDILAWNPLLHCIDLFRTSFFSGYEPFWLDISYMTIFSLAILCVGLVSERLCKETLLKELH